MSYAIIETGGKQLRVEPGRFYDIELLHVDEQAQVTIDKVFLVKHNDDVTIGQPFVEGATVEGTVMRHRRGKKVIVYKMRPKKKTRKKRGHRQEITQLMINSISINGAAIASDLEASDEVQVVDSEVQQLVEISTPEETTPTVTIEAQVAEPIPAADEPDAQTIEPDEAQQAADSVISTAEETTPTVTIEAQVAEPIPAADEPDAQTIEPDEAQQAADSVVAEEPDPEIVTTEQTPETASE